MKELIIVLAILIAGYGALAMWLRHDRRKVQYIKKDISGEKYITEDIGKGENNG